MKTIKKILSIAIFFAIFIGSMFTLTACNLVVTDKSAYYSQTVATFTYNDATYSVSMKELNQAFKDYGYNYYIKGYFSNMEECLEASLNYHIQRSLIALELENKFNSIYSDTHNELYHNELYNLDFVDQEKGWEGTLSNIYTSTNPNAIEIRYNAFESMQDNIDSFAKAILEEEGKLGNVETTEPETIRDTKKEYESKVDYEFEYVFNETTGTTEKKLKYLKLKFDELELFDKTNVSEHFVLGYTYDEVTTNKAYARYIKSLQQIAKSEGRSTEEQDVLRCQEELEIRNAYISKLLEIYEYYYNTTTTIDTQVIVDYYKDQYINQYRNFQYNEEAYNTAMSKSNSEYVYYHKSPENYIEVSHILINFTEEQKALISELDAKLEADKANVVDETELEKLQTQHDNKVMEIITNTKCEYELNGEKKTDYYSEIVEYIKNYVNDGLSGSVMSETELARTKAKRFDDLIYMFNDDPGMMNSDFHYSVNITDGFESSYDQNFVNGAIELYNNYNVGDVLLEPVSGEVLAKPVASQYGIHIMFYSNKVSNIKSIENIDQLTYIDLLSTYVNAASDKSVFEYLYDKISTSNNYSNHTSSLIKQLYNDSDITIDTYKF